MTPVLHDVYLSLPRCQMSIHIYPQLSCLPVGSIVYYKTRMESRLSAAPFNATIFINVFKLISECNITVLGLILLGRY